jgi:hypothetical protein
VPARAGGDGGGVLRRVVVMKLQRQSKAKQTPPGWLRSCSWRADLGCGLVSLYAGLSEHMVRLKCIGPAGTVVLVKAAIAAALEVDSQAVRVEVVLNGRLYLILEVQESVCTPPIMPPHYLHGPLTRAAAGTETRHGSARPGGRGRRGIITQASNSGRGKLAHRKMTSSN